MSSSVYDLHAPQLLGLFVLILVGFDWLGLLFVRPFLFFFVRGQRYLNELVGYVLGFYSVIYGLLIGMLIVGGYQNYVEVRGVVAQEATQIAGLFRVTQVLPATVNAEIRSNLIAYIQTAIDEEWPQQRAGIVPNSQNPQVTAIQQSLFAFEPTTRQEEMALGKAVDIFYDLFDARRLRVNAAAEHLPGILWFVVILGAFSTLVLIWLFDVKVILHLVLGGLLAFFVATMLAVLVELDNPFSSDVGVTPDPLVIVQQYMTAEQ